jgi:hypothetical protein
MVYIVSICKSAYVCKAPSLRTCVTANSVNSNLITALSLLLDHHILQEMIDTVRETKIHSVRGHTTKAEFMISRFKLHVRVLLTALPGTNTVEFELDPHCTVAGKSVLKEVILLVLLTAICYYHSSNAIAATVSVLLLSVESFKLRYLQVSTLHTVMQCCCSQRKYRTCMPARQW